MESEFFICQKIVIPDNKKLLFNGIRGSISMFHIYAII